MTDPMGRAAMHARLPGWMLLVTIFLTGATVMMVEVGGTRVVGPFFGVGIYVWSALITVTLLALAAGYWFGGRWADEHAKPEWLYLIILLASVFIVIIPLTRTPVLTAAGLLGIRGGALAGSALLFGFPLFLLGMVTPLATKLYTRQFAELGSRVGVVYAISTLGSFLGTLVMGFVLIPQFALSRIFFALGLVLFFNALVYFWLIRRFAWPFFMGALLLGVAMLMLAPEDIAARWINANVRVVHSTNSFYGQIKVLDYGHNRLLLIDGVTQSGITVDTQASFPPYVRDMDSVVHRYSPGARSALLLGLGGGNMISFLLERNLQVDVVEIDPKVSEVAQTYFGVDASRVRLVQDDGRRFVRATRKTYDVVLLNTFSGETFPNHLLTREFFQEVRQILNPQGIVVLNFVGYVQGPQRAAAEAVFATLRASNDWCRVYFREPKHRFSNILYVAGAGAVPPAAGTEVDAARALAALEVPTTGWESAQVCTDDYNPVEFLNRDVYRRWRQLVMDSLGPEILLD